MTRGGWLRRLLRRERPGLVQTSWDHQVQDRSVTVRLDPVAVPGGETVQLSVSSDDKDTSHFLRTLLVTDATLILQDGDELNVLGRWADVRSPQDPRVSRALRDLEVALDTPRLAPPAICTTWWTKRANFGDLLGPVMVHQLTGRPVVHPRFARTEDPPLFTVGSVLTFGSVPGAQVWGSGLIKPLSEAEVARMRGWTPPRVYAVRGQATAAQLRQRLGWEVPDVFGDPALLAPRLLAPTGQTSSGGPVVVPHGVHESIFAARPELLDQLTWVNPSQGPQRVIEQIASASHCISSSLHGVLVAHAFGVPWTWLRVTDQPLLGDEFKFEDFFTGLDREQVSRLDVTSAELSPQALAEGIRNARRPRDHYDLDRLQDAFPDQV